MDKLKNKVIKWLKTKTKEDITYVKDNPEIDIFLAHPGMTRYDAEKLVEEPDKIMSVMRSLSHENRLCVLRIFSKKFNTEYIILDPFYTDIEKKFFGKVAIVTFYPSKRKKLQELR